VYPRRSEVHGARAASYAELETACSEGLFRRHRASLGSKASPTSGGSEGGTVSLRRTGKEGGSDEEDACPSPSQGRDAGAMGEPSDALLKDPLLLFGGLAPPALRRSKGDFATALEYYIQVR
jgi:hypothetical protein